jgi:hypothetical protein
MCEHVRGTARKSERVGGTPPPTENAEGEETPPTLSLPCHSAERRPMGKQQPHTGRRRTQRTRKEMPRAKSAKRLRVVGGKEERSEEPKARSAASEAQRASERRRVEQQDSQTQRSPQMTAVTAARTTELRRARRHVPRLPRERLEPHAAQPARGTRRTHLTATETRATCRRELTAVRQSLRCSPPAST